MTIASILFTGPQRQRQITTRRRSSHRTPQQQVRQWQEGHLGISERHQQTSPQGAQGCSESHVSL